MILCVCTGQFSIVALILTLLLQVCGAFIETIIFYFRGKGNSLREVEWRILKPAGWWILSATFSLFYDWGRGRGLDTWGFRSSGVTPKGRAGLLLPSEFQAALWNTQPHYIAVFMEVTEMGTQALCGAPLASWLIKACWGKEIWPMGGHLSAREITEFSYWGKMGRNKEECSRVPLSLFLKENLPFFVVPWLRSLSGSPQFSQTCHSVTLPASAFPAHMSYNLMLIHDWKTF